MIKEIATVSQKKLFWFIATGIVSLSSYSVYRSVSTVKLDLGSTKSKQASSSSRLNLKESSWSLKDERPILDRNIFNSEGELGEGFEELVNNNQLPAGELVKSDLPLKLLGVIFAGDPKNGLALVEDTQKRRALSYLVGDNVKDDAKLIEIYEDRIILLRGDRREYIEREAFEIARSRRKAKSGGFSSGDPGLVAGKTPESYREEGFERDGSQILISEEFKRSLLQPDSMTKVLQDAKAEPNIVGGEIRGFRLTRIRDNSIYLKAGFQDGDVVEEINGIPLRDAAGAIRLLQQLKNANNIEAKVKRGGSSFNMMINIQ